MADFGILGRLSVDALDRIRLMASELVTNVLLHTKSTMRLDLIADEEGLTVAVTDAGSGIPTLRASGAANDMSGRGIRIVDALADAWGVQPGSADKTVWFTVAFDRP